MSEIDDLVRAANSLRWHGEEEHAENVNEYVNSRVGRWPEIYSTLRSAVYWALIAALIVIGFGGASDLALSGRYFAAVGLLVVVVAVYAFLRLAERFARSVQEHTENELSEI